MARSILRPALYLLSVYALHAQIPGQAFFKGDPQKVMLFCAEQARSLKPHKERVLAQVGRAYLIAGDPEKADAMFRLAGPGDAETNRWIGQAWLEAGDPKRALPYFSQIAIRERFAKNAMTEGAVVLMDGGHPKDAEALMTQAFAVDPGDWQNVTAFARACLRQHRPELAAAWFAQTVASNRKEEDLWMEIAQSLADKGAER